MAQKLDPRQTLEFRGLLISKMVQSEALMNVLGRKGVHTKEELHKEIERINAVLIRAES